MLLLTFLSALVSAFSENEFVLKHEANFMSKQFVYILRWWKHQEKNPNIHHIIASHFY